MNRMQKWCVLVVICVAATAGSVNADVKTRDKTQVKFEGMLGRMVGMFGGKAAKDGVLTNHAVKGDRKIELMGDANGRIIDLKEEKVYELDLKKKTYEVTTFADLRRRMQEAREQAEKAQREAPKEERPQDDSGKPAREMEFDFDVKETGQTRTIAGHNAREVIMTVVMREKGKTLEESGGVVLTSNSWMGPAIPAMKEFAEFEMRYWKAIAPEAAGISPEQMAAVMAMYPLLGKAMERMKAEGTKLEGTPLASTVTFEGVKSKEAMDQQGQQSSCGGLGGMLARRMVKQDTKPRTLVFTTNHEMLEISTAVGGTELDIPAGFKEKK
jgi:hypothetical protein